MPTNQTLHNPKWIDKHWCKYRPLSASDEPSAYHLILRCCWFDSMRFSELCSSFEYFVKICFVRSYLLQCCFACSDHVDGYCKVNWDSLKYSQVIFRSHLSTKLLFASHQVAEADLVPLWLFYLCRLTKYVAIFAVHGILIEQPVLHLLQNAMFLCFCQFIECFCEHIPSAIQQKCHVFHGHRTHSSSKIPIAFLTGIQLDISLSVFKFLICLLAFVVIWWIG